MSNNDKKILDLVRRYEQTIAENKSVYFDADQFSDIADYYDKIGDIESARDLLDIGLQIHPESDILLLKKAKIYVYDGDYELALSILSIAFSGYDFDFYMVKTECLLQMGKKEEAAKLVATILEHEEDQDLQATLADLGFLYIEADEYEEAINFFEESIKLDPENTEVLADLAYAYEMVGDFENAITITNKILDNDSYSYDSWINLGKLHSLEEDYEKAVDAFDFALTINDSDVNILKLKAHCLSLSDRPLDAMQIFRELLKETPDDSSLYLLLCECYASLELFTEAMECLTIYEANIGDTVELALKKATLFYQMDQADQALVVVENAFKAHGRQLELLLLCGDIKYSMENFEEAELDFKEAYLLESDNFDVLDKLATIYIRLGKYPEAINLTEELLLLEPENNEIRQQLALLFLEIDDKDKFNYIIDGFSDEELMDLFKLFYNPKQPDLFDRQMLIASLNEAREYRTLFKNLKH